MGQIKLAAIKWPMTFVIITVIDEIWAASEAAHIIQSVSVNCIQP